MREGGLDAPIRHPIDWENQDYYNEEALDTEMRRVFDICHSCRRCFNLCDSFPQLFDLIDNSPSGELDSVDSKGFQKVNDACTLCDMCFMVSCPYVPPHEFNIDFPKLVLRSRAIDYQKGKVGPIKRLLAKTDFHGKWGSTFSKLSNWATSSHNKFTRQILEWVAGIHKEATLPKYASQTLVNATQNQIPLNKEAPGFGEKVVIYATCFGNFNAPEIGLALRAVLALNGVETLISYPKCCGMPLLEEGNLKQVAENAKIVSNELLPFVAKGYKVLALVPSCALMLKHEWPLLLPNDNHIKKLANATYDLSEYIVELAKEKGLVPGLKPIEGGISIHLPCHARAQNIGHKAVEMLRLIPDTQIHVVERCSGHGGSWGVMKENFPTAIKQGKPVVKQIMKQKPSFVVSECPLAGDHILQGLDIENVHYEDAPNPIELIALSYGLLAQRIQYMFKTEILRQDILALPDYEKIRKEKQKNLLKIKTLRRVSVGPYATFYFENYDTMWYQIHEMLRIEKGGDAQIEDELSAYSPLIPKGQELVATLMFEIEDKNLRHKMLNQWGGIENMAYIQMDGERLFGKPESDQERSEPDGRTASVHFVRFSLSPAQIKQFTEPNHQIILGFDHPLYGHMTVLNQETKQELSKDFQN